MTKRSPVSPAPGPLEDFAQSFDDLFGARAQRHSFRRYWNYPEVADGFHLRHLNLLHCSLLVVGRAQVA
jgi:hypothetical protein